MTDISSQASIQDARTGTAQDAAQDMQAEAAGMAAAPDPNMDATGNAPTNATAPADVAESGDHDSGSFVLGGENQDTSVPEEGTKEAEKTEKSDKTDKAKKSGKTGKTRKSGASGKSARKKAATRRRATTGSESEKGMTEAEPPKEWTTPVPFATRTLPELDCAKLPPVLGEVVLLRHRRPHRRLPAGADPHEQGRHHPRDDDAHLPYGNGKKHRRAKSGPRSRRKTSRR